VFESDVEEMSQAIQRKSVSRPRQRCQRFKRKTVSKKSKQIKSFLPKRNCSVASPVSHSDDGDETFAFVTDWD
jgi:hypothetical protein